MHAAVVLLENGDITPEKQLACVHQHRALIFQLSCHLRALSESKSTSDVSAAQFKRQLAGIYHA